MFIVFIALFVFACISEGSEKLFVVQGLDESAACIDLTSGEVDAQAVTLGNIPNDIVAASSRVYVSNSGYNSIQEIDPISFTTVREIEVTGGVNVWSMTLLNEDSMAVTCSVSNNVIVIRLSDEQVVATIPTGPGPQGIVSRGERFYVCVTGVAWPDYGPSYVLAFDRHSLARVDSLPVGVNGQAAAFDDENRLHVVCTGDYVSIGGEVHVIDLGTGETEAVLDVGGTPNGISLSNDFAFVAAGGWGSEGYVFSYRLTDLAVLHDAASPITTAPGAFDVEAREDGFYVSCFNDDVVEFRSTDGALLQSYPVSDGPGQMAVFAPASGAPGRGGASEKMLSLVRAYPNPFNSSVEIQFEVMPSHPVTINIYNCLGELVRVLNAGWGAESATWNARDSNGKSVSSGVYLYSMILNEKVVSNRLIYMK